MASHGPLMMLALGLLLGGLNLLAIGLLGEMQVRHYHEPSHRAPYSVDRVLRSPERRTQRLGIEPIFSSTSPPASRPAATQ